MEILGNNGDVLMRLLSAATERSRLLAGNVANQNTPGYKRQSLQFEELLAKELESSRPSLDRVQAQRVIDTQTTGSPNGNNVNMEKEVAAMRENMLRYEMYATILKGSTKLVESAIHGDR